MAHRGQQGVQGGAQGGLAVGHRLQVGERGTQRGGAKNSTVIYSAALNSTVINRTAEGGAAVQGGPKDGAEVGGDINFLSATRTPPAPSILRGGRYWFQLGMHNPQLTTRAAVEASHFRYRASHIHARAHFELTATSVQSQPAAHAKVWAYEQRRS